MADIIMCSGLGMNEEGQIISCPFKQDCYRHTAVENPHRQSYFIEIPLVVVISKSGKADASCLEFISNAN